MLMAHSVRLSGTLPALVATALAGQTNLANWNTVKALKPGTDVRIAAGPRTVRGIVDRITDDTMVVTGHRMSNALIGLGAGTGVGLGIGLDARSREGVMQIVPNRT